MMIWLAVAFTGFILALAGLVSLFRRYSRGEITRLYLLATVVGFISFVTYALLDSFRPDIMKGPLTLIVLLPAIIAIPVVIRERRSKS